MSAFGLTDDSNKALDTTPLQGGLSCWIRFEAGRNFGPHPVVAGLYAVSMSATCTLPGGGGWCRRLCLLTRTRYRRVGGWSWSERSAPAGCSYSATRTLYPGGNLQLRPNGSGAGSVAGRAAEGRAVMDQEHAAALRRALGRRLRLLRVLRELSQEELAVLSREVGLGRVTTRPE